MQVGHNTLCVGIDLGTTNSAIATCSVENGKVNTPVSGIERCVDVLSRGRMKRERGELLPSCVFYSDTGEGYEAYVGDIAKKISLTRPHAVARSIKKQMGEKYVNIPGWLPEYPDQTPEAIASKILKHLVSELESYHDEKIDDVVITVPASFNLAQSEATLRAAELAGINVRTAEGNLRDDILLSEPEAVIYNVLNQIQNGSINIPIDFSTSKKIMVFDIGGGTLDITLHEICKRSSDSMYFDIKPIATNRFSLIAGDTFDETLAEWMFREYVSEYRRGDIDTARKIEADKVSLMTEMITYAEETKVLLNDQYKDRLKRNGLLSQEHEIAYGGSMQNGLNSDGYISLKDYEDCLRPLLGYNYTYRDYKRFDSIRDDGNIIFPVLDVLHKAAEKLNVEDVKIDAVIMNGGMSRLYLIENRLKEFFGFKPITISDPDKSVAQGAAIYHYYLHQNNFTQEHENNSSETNSTRNPMSLHIENTFRQDDNRAIRSIGNILNETIYLGLSGGAVKALAFGGEELPYDSGKITGYSIQPGHHNLAIPIKQATADKNVYRTIAIGGIHLQKRYQSPTPVSIQFWLRRGGIMLFQAWTSYDLEGNEKIESANVTLNLGGEDSTHIHKVRNRIQPSNGTHLVPANELCSFKALINNFANPKKTANRLELKNKLKQKKKIICACGNPEDFVQPILDLLNGSPDNELAKNLLPVARTLSKYWNNNSQLLLSKACLSLISKEFSGLHAQGNGINVVIEAIMTIGTCGVQKDCMRLTELKYNTRYRSALLYAFGVSAINHAWIYAEFRTDVMNHRAMQESLRNLGLSLIKNPESETKLNYVEVLECVIDALADGDLSLNETSIAFVTLAAIYQKIILFDYADPLKIRLKINRCIEEVCDSHGGLCTTYTLKARELVQNMLYGETLSAEDEAYLLGLFLPDEKESQK